MFPVCMCKGTAHEVATIERDATLENALEAKIELHQAQTQARQDALSILGH